MYGEGALLLVGSCFFTVFTFAWMIFVWINLSNINDKLRELVNLNKQSMGIEQERRVTIRSLAKLASQKAGETVGKVSDRATTKKGTYKPNLIFCTKCGGANERGHTACLAVGTDWCD